MNIVTEILNSILAVVGTLALLVMLGAVTAAGLVVLRAIIELAKVVKQSWSN